MEITKDTIVLDILNKYGDIAEVMEVLGVKRVGRYSIRRIITRFLTVQRAAKVHKVQLRLSRNLLDQYCNITCSGRLS